jgi:hypothetical protein
VTLDRERLLYDAKADAIALADGGYTPAVLGQSKGPVLSLELVASTMLMLVRRQPQTAR